jgi:hypothetical protein
VTSGHNEIEGMWIILVVTNTFPFGPWHLLLEPFLERVLSELKKSFH